VSDESGVKGRGWLVATLGRSDFREVVVDGRIILKRIVGKYVWNCVR